MTITAKIIADSISAHGKRITSFQLRYPKFIHSEFMTHRVFSRNASSSRAIPFERLVEDVERDPVLPSYWGANQPGMQARAEIDPLLHGTTAHMWLLARDAAISQARNLHALGVHKQIVNRLIEPFSHINVIVTATEWSNFFALRCHPDAQPEIRILAEAIRAARDSNIPQALSPDEWHTPYVDKSDWTSPGMRWELAVRLSVARCARVSYLTHAGKKPDMARDIALYNQLVSAVPLHASPAEHQAKPDVLQATLDHGHVWFQPHLHGNLVGWIQHRKTLPGESQ